MTTKQIIIGIFWVAAIVLFVLVGFDLANPKEFDFLGIGLALTVGGFALDKFWAQP